MEGYGIQHPNRRVRVVTNGVEHDVWYTPISEDHIPTPDEIEDVAYLIGRAKELKAKFFEAEILKPYIEKIHGQDT